MAAISSDLTRLDPAPVGAGRVALVDAARGVALAAMVVYHFAWDLRFFGYIETNVVADPAWRIFARTIAGSFLFLVGISLVLATRRGFDTRRFLRRLAVLAAAAGAITAATWFVFPDAFIFFGILHCIAVSSVIGLAFLRAPVWLVAAAALLALAAPHLLAGPAFDQPALIWLGLATREPRSNDFVPLFPWLGVVLLGILAARLAPKLLPGSVGHSVSAPGILVWAGRRSLPIYLVHQPVLFGLVYLAAQIAPPAPPSFAEWHEATCTAQCVAADREAGACRALCGCLTDKAEGAGLGPALVAGRLGPEDTGRYFALAAQCEAGSGE